jgi:hypothetical protein
MRFVLPRPHRLFVAFDDHAAAEAALRSLVPEVTDVWFFEGRSGAEELDPGGPKPSRLFSWVLSHNVEYLEDLSRTVTDGRTVVAVPARTLGVAEDMSHRLHRHGGQVLAYTAHWNFVPVQG